MLNVRDEVEALLADMRAKVLTVEDVRDSIHVAAIVRQTAIPDVPQDMIPAIARATLLGAWVQYDAMRKLQQLAA